MRHLRNERRWKMGIFLKFLFIVALATLSAATNSSEESVESFEDSPKGFIPLEIFPDELGREALKESASRTSRIVYGSYASQNQFPYFGYYVRYMKAGGTSFCGSSLISPQWLVTAAHCMSAVSAVQAYFGSTDKQSMPISRNGAGFILHEKYNLPSLRANDIALIKLVSPVPLSASVQPIQLPRRSTAKVTSYAGVTLTASGFGNTLSGYPRYLQWTDLGGISNSECSRFFGIIIDSMLCAKGLSSSGSSVCSGDSGGPLTALVNGTPVLVGINAFVQNTGCVNNVQGFMRLDYQLDWINTNANINASW